MMTDEELFTAIEEKLAQHGLKKTWLYSQLHVSGQTFNNWRSRRIPERHRVAIAKIFGWDPVALIQNTVVPSNNQQELVADSSMKNGFARVKSVEIVATRPVPLISWVKAGEWCESPEGGRLDDAEEWMPSPYRHGKRAFCLEVIGDSMWPEYREKEIILVDPDVEPRHNDDVVVRNDDGKHTFKRLQITPEGTYLLALNPDHPERKIKAPPNSAICGVVIGSWMRRR